MYGRTSDKASFCGSDSSCHRFIFRQDLSISHTSRHVCILQGGSSLVGTSGRGVGGACACSWQLLVARMGERGMQAGHSSSALWCLLRELHSCAARTGRRGLVGAPPRCADLCKAGAGCRRAVLTTKLDGSGMAPASSAGGLSSCWNAATQCMVLVLLCFISGIHLSWQAVWTRGSCCDLAEVQ